MILDTKKEVCKTLGIPDIPKKKWDGESSFDKAACTIECIDGSTHYGICSYNKDTDSNIKITNVFNTIPFVKVIDVYPLPLYMDDNVDEMEFDDDESYNYVNQLLEEKEEIINKGVEPSPIEEFEWGYPFIANKEQAMAYMKELYKKDKKKGAIPTKDEVLKSALRVRYNMEKHK